MCFDACDLTANGPQEGNSFFDGWAFQTGPDSTTGGAVTYVDLNTGVCCISFSSFSEIDIYLECEQLDRDQQCRKRCYACGDDAHSS